MPAITNLLRKFARLLSNWLFVAFSFHHQVDLFYIFKLRNS